MMLGFRFLRAADVCSKVNTFAENARRQLACPQIRQIDWRTVLIHARIHTDRHVRGWLNRFGPAFAELP